MIAHTDVARSFQDASSGCRYRKTGWLAGFLADQDYTAHTSDKSPAANHTRPHPSEVGRWGVKTAESPLPFPFLGPCFWAPGRCRKHPPDSSQHPLIFFMGTRGIPMGPFYHSGLNPLPPPLPSANFWRAVWVVGPLMTLPTAAKERTPQSAPAWPQWDNSTLDVTFGGETFPR